MRKILLFALSAILVCCLLASCGGDGKKPTETTPTADATTTTAAPADNTTEPTVETTTSAPETTPAPTPTETTPAAPETTVPEPVEDKVIKIGTAEELFAFADSTHEATADYDGYTILFTDDIDLSAKNWIPMEGIAFFDTTFDGQGHTISYMTIEGAEKETYLGFIGHAQGGTITFQNMTFDNCKITAYGKECAFFVGQNEYSELIFNNVTVSNSTVDGYMDWNNSGLIAMRVAAFVGGNWRTGSVTIDNCHVKDFTASAFHNLAAFVGYDSQYLTTVTNSTVEGMHLTFSYCMASSYTVDQNSKYVSVLYNLAKWEDNYADIEAGHNTYSDVTYIDFTTGKSYLPEEFRTGVELKQG